METAQLTYRPPLLILFICLIILLRNLDREPDSCWPRRKTRKTDKEKTVSAGFL